MIKKLFKKLIANDEKIEDFGKKIDGAKKHLAKFQLGLEQGKMTTFKPKHLSDAGLSNIAIATIIRLKSRATKHWQKRQAIDKIQDIVIGALDDDDVKSIWNSFTSIYRTYPSVELIEKSSIEEVAMLAKMEIYTSMSHNSVLESQPSRKKVRRVISNGKITQEEADKFFLDETKAIQIQKEVDKKSSDKPKTKKKKLSLYTHTRGDLIVLQAKIATGKFIELRTFQDKETLNDFLRGENKDENWDELRKILSEKQKQPTTRTPENKPRTGASTRIGDMSTDQFHKDYPFRGVQFGNWVNQKERQENVNRAYDALADLSTIVDMDGTELTHNGELALAFGARGKGGKNAPMAHYEPAQDVINLTKRKGAGTLAHEWFHSFDMYLGRQSGGSVMMSEMGRASYDEYQEVFNAMRVVINAIHKMEFYANSKEYDKSRTKDYWSTNLELIARAFEAYSSHTLSQKEVKNDYLVNYLENSEVYPSKRDMEILSPLFDKLFKEAKNARNI